MKKLISIILPIAIAISFTACGGGGGGDASFSDSDKTVAITIACVASPSSNDFANYVTLNSGDTIVNDAPNTNVSTYHTVGGEKKVCLNSGAAHILRN